MWQPIQVFKHPAFQYMIHIASCATNGVKIPNCHQTCEAIIDLFKQQLTMLHNKLDVWYITISIVSILLLIFNYLL